MRAPVGAEEQQASSDEPTREAALSVCPALRAWRASCSRGLSIDRARGMEEVGMV
jgi:hypothetical protein